MKIKKLVKTLLVTTSLATIVSAGSIKATMAEEAKSTDNYIKSDFEITLNAYAHFQAGYRNQNNLSSGSEKNVSHNRKDFAFYNDSAFSLVAKKSQDEVIYGAKIALVPTTKKSGSPNYNGTHIFVESSFGKVELGSPINAGSTMHTDGYSIVAATGDDFSRYTDFSIDHMKQSATATGTSLNGNTFQGNDAEPSFTTYSEFFLDSKLVTKRDDRKFSSEPSRAVSYYTPKFKFDSGTNIQLGVTYIPDSSNTGAGSATDQSSGTTKIKITENESFEFDTTVKDAFSGGICIEQNFSDGVDFKLAVTGEHGKAAGKATRISGENKDKKEYKLKDLRSYNIGGVLNVGNFALAGSYGSLGKSLTTSAYHKTGRETSYYTGAIAYTYGPFKSSLSYFKSEQNKNTLDAISLGTEFKLAPGLKPYAEVSTFTLKGKPEFFPELKKKKTKGTVALLGLKLKL